MFATVTNKTNIIIIHTIKKNTSYMYTGGIVKSQSKAITRVERKTFFCMNSPGVGPQSLSRVRALPVRGRPIVLYLTSSKIHVF